MDMQSKAKKLIEIIQTAPVEWKPLGEVAELKRGKTITAKVAIDGGIPVISGGQQPAYYHNEANRTGETITVAGSGAYAGFIMYWDEPIFVSDAFSIKPNIEVLNTRYIYYFLLQNQGKIYNLKKGSGVPHVYPKDLALLTIPIPPLETQQKIVKILDKFTELEATLEAELALRKRQYQYYRDFLLDFDNQIGGGIADGYKGRLKDVVWKTLGEVFDLKNGYTPSKSNKEYWENGSIPWFRMEDIRENGRILDNSLQHISKSAVKGGKLFPSNSIIIATSATIGEHALITVPFLANQRFTSLSLKPEFADKLSIYFLYYYCFNLSEWCKKNTTTSSFASVDMNGFKRFPIPIPPLPEQEKIAAILDKFDTLTHSISEGLPHEIALRRKQYEYYREQLLAFPKAT